MTTKTICDDQGPADFGLPGLTLLKPMKTEKKVDGFDAAVAVLKTTIIVFLMAIWLRWVLTEAGYYEVASWKYLVCTITLVVFTPRGLHGLVGFGLAVGTGYLLLMR